MEFQVLSVLLFANSYLLIAVTGELVIERSPECPEDSAVYRCTATTGSLDWVWGSEQQLLLFTGVSNFRIRTWMIQGVTVVLNATAVGQTINVVATIPNNVSLLNGLLMTCNGQELTINITLLNSLPSSLVIFQNESEVTIIPRAKGGDLRSVQYQLQDGAMMNVTQEPIILNASESITFTNCMDSVTFSINCELEDSNEQFSYILFPNGVWEISRVCGIIRVNCTSGNWSEDISCLSTTSNTSAQTESTAVPTVIATRSVTSMSIIVGSSTTTVSSGTNSGIRRISPYVWIGVAVGIAVAVITFVLVLIIVLLLCKLRKRKSRSLEELELNHVEEDSNEYSTLTHPSQARSTMSVDAYDTINSGFTSRQPPEAPSYGVLNGNAATARDQPQNRVENRTQDRAQDRESDTDSHQYAKTKHIPQKSKSNDMMYSEVAMGDQATIHPHLSTESGVQYSGVQHGVRPEDTSLNLDTLLIQLRPVTDQYQELGVAAGLSQETIEEITSHAAVAFDGLVEVCDAWIRSLRRQDTAPTWRAVSDMLQEIGQEKLARDLLKVYTTGSLPVMVDMHTVEIPKQATQSPPPPVPQRNDVDMDEDSEVAMAMVVSIRRDRVPTESEMSPPPPIPPFHPNEDQAMAVPPRPPKKGAPQPGAPAIPPKPLPSPAPEAIPSLPPKPNKKA